MLNKKMRDNIFTKHAEVTEVDFESSSVGVTEILFGIKWDGVFYRLW